MYIMFYSSCVYFSVGSLTFYAHIKIYNYMFPVNLGNMLIQFNCRYELKLKNIGGRNHITIIEI